MDSPVSLPVICVVPMTTTPQSQLPSRVKPREMYSGAGTEPPDLAIIHRPKSPPCTRPAIFIPPLNVFFPATSLDRPGAGVFFFFHREQLSYFRPYLNLGDNSMNLSHNHVVSPVNDVVCTTSVFFTTKYIIQYLHYQVSVWFIPRAAKLH